MKAMDMTKGSPFGLLVKFAIPIALGFMLQNAYALGDSLIVSLSRGSVEATGVNITGSLNFLVWGFAIGFSAGFGIVLAQFVGAKDEEKMRKSVATSIILGASIALVLSVSAALLAGWFLRLMNTDALYYSHALAYIRTVFAGMTFMFMYNLSEHIMRAMGDSRTPLIILCFCAALNIGLNSLMFAFPALGVEWAAWATVISQGLSAIVGYTVIFKKFPTLRVKKEDFRFSAKFAWHHLKIGFPMALQFTITASGCMFQQRAFNNLEGSLYEMAQSTASKIDNVFASLLTGSALAMATYVGQNYGAKNFDRIRKGYFTGWIVGIIFTVLAATAFIALSVPIARLLLMAETVPGGGSEEVYALVFQYASFQSLFYYALYLLLMSRQALQGIGKSVAAMMGGVVELITRIVVCETFAVWWGFLGACLSNTLAWVTGAIYLVIAFLVVLKRRRQTEDRPLTPIQ